MRTRSSIHRRAAALARSLVALFCVLLVLSPQLAWAGATYEITNLHNEAYGSCEAPNMAHNGDDFFAVNTVPLPTYEISQAWENGDGSQSMNWAAGFDSVLLQPGVNDFHFQIANSSGDDTCVVSHDYSTLSSPVLSQPKVLFDISRNGTAYSGNRALNFGLSEINPPLARDIVNLERAVQTETQFDVDNASKVTDLAGKLDALRSLDTELHDLVNRPLDEISNIDLDAILNRYANVVDPATRAAMEQLVDDLKKSVDDLKAELGRLLDDFGQQASDVADLATKGARDGGFDPADPSNYVPAASDDGVPSVDVPQVADGGGFDPSHDPYKTYADNIIARLDATTANGEVVARAQWVGIIRGWEKNDKALAAALKARSGVSIAETSAFLAAESRVKGHIRLYMSDTSWFLETPVPTPLQAYVDGVLKAQFSEAADRLKDALNLWPERELSPAEQAVADSIRGFSAGISALAGVFDDALEPQRMMLSYTATAARIGIGFVPVVGDALDLCEAISGHEWCLPGGRELSDEERLLSALGVVIGNAEFWRGAKNEAGALSGITCIGGALPLRPMMTASPLSKPCNWFHVAGEAEELVATRLGKGLKLNRVKQWKNLRGAVAGLDKMDEFEKILAQTSLDGGRKLFGLGDDSVRAILEMPKDMRAADFLSITAEGRLAITECKNWKNLTPSVAFEQLENVIDKLTAKGYGSDISVIELAINKNTAIAGDFVVKGDQLWRVSSNAPVRIKGYLVHIVQVAADFGG